MPGRRAATGPAPVRANITRSRGGIPGTASSQAAVLPSEESASVQASMSDEPTSFVRVMVLPLALRGKSSIRYVKSEDQARPKSQTYTVFVDAPVAP